MLTCDKIYVCVYMYISTFIQRSRIYERANHALTTIYIVSTSMTSHNSRNIIVHTNVDIAFVIIL